MNANRRQILGLVAGLLLPQPDRYPAPAAAVPDSPLQPGSTPRGPRPPNRLPSPFARPSPALQRSVTSARDGCPNRPPELRDQVEPDATPEWLEAWLRLPRLQFLACDLPLYPDPAQRETASVLLPLIAAGATCAFRYHGGTEPARSREVLPVLLFSTTDEDNLDWEPDCEPLYLLAYCLTRRAPRTFRLDRIQFTAASLTDKRITNPES